MWSQIIEFSQSDTNLADCLFKLILEAKYSCLWFSDNSCGLICLTVGKLEKSKADNFEKGSEYVISTWKTYDLLSCAIEAKKSVSTIFSLWHKNAK